MPWREADIPLENQSNPIGSAIRLQRRVPRAALIAGVVVAGAIAGYAIYRSVSGGNDYGDIDRAA